MGKIMGSPTIPQEPDWSKIDGPATTWAEKEAKAQIPDDPQERYRTTKGTHRLCKRCQLVQTANESQICDSCASGDKFYANSNQPRLVEFITMVGHEQPISVRSNTNDGGSIIVPYLTWRRAEDGHLSLLLDNRLGLDLPLMPDHREDAVVEFIANAIAIGAGYASIYYTKRKMPFRG